MTAQDTERPWRCAPQAHRRPPRWVPRAIVIRSIGTSDSRFPHTGATRYTITAPRIPALAISNPDADALVRQFESGKPVRLRIRSSSRDLPPMRSANVVGEIPGTDRAGEIVILGAHLDSWDPGVGAIDDGAGVAIMMGVAKLIQELDVKPRRTIRVVLFANEEFGTSGSLAYLAANEAEVARNTCSDSKPISVRARSGA